MRAVVYTVHLFPIINVRSPTGSRQNRNPLATYRGVLDPSPDLRDSERHGMLQSDLDVIFAVDNDSRKR
jgi:hypothetical protein